MKKMSANIDGFSIPRRDRSQEAGQRADVRQMKIPEQYLQEEQITSDSGEVAHDSAKRHTGTIGAVASSKATIKGLGDIDISLPEDTAPQKKRRSKSRFKKVIKIVVVLLIIGLLVGGGYFAWRAIGNASRVFKGNIFNAVFSNKPLKTDQYGRTNMLVFGTSEDDPGHDGAQLTDSIMVVSIDQKKKDAFLVSVPRDLWVKFGQACNSGYEGKINEVYVCGKGRANDETAGQTALRSMVGKVFGIDLQYSVHIDYTVVRQAVDAVGGVDIVIESPDKKGILDRNFDWRCRYQCYLVKWPNGPAHLDGEHALFLAQARNDNGGYGLPRGNFDREENQRKILMALKDKATSAGFLSNPLAVTQLLDSLGNNVRTNIDAEEIKSFIQAAKEIDSKKVQSLSLVNADNQLMTTGASPGGASIVKPAAGLYEYTKLQNFVLTYLKGQGPLLAEKATVDVLNGSGVSGKAQQKADALAPEGINATRVATAPAGTYPKTVWYDLSAGKKPVTQQKLQDLLGAPAAGTVLPTNVTSTSNFVIIIGTDGAN